jgi:hypothetical protein
MRSSSIKSLVVTLTLTATVLATIPAEAKPAPAPRTAATTSVARPGDPLNGLLERIGRMLRRIGGTISFAEPSIPLPAPSTGGPK